MTMLKTTVRAAITAAVLALSSVVAPVFAQTKITIGTGVDPSFSAYYVAKLAGIFEKNGLDVQLNTGPSGSAMVAFVIQNQIQSAFGAEQAGIQNFNIDPNVVVAAEGAQMGQWYGMVARGYTSLDQLKGKRIGVARGSGSEVFWLAMVDNLKLNPKDYTIVQVEAPEMIAAMERGNIDAFTSWEPWLTRAVKAIPDAKVVVNSDGILSPRVYVYVNKGWAEKNKPAALAFMRSMVEASDLITKDPEAAAGHVATFLKLDKALTLELVKKVRFDMRLDQGSINNFELQEVQLKGLGKLAKPVDWKNFVYPDLLKEVKPAAVNYELPKPKS
ncbi:MAG: ABC transporter substrate-binding protein [Rhizobiales bacterium]|nr:ABC transporter substrate-binding protein [Hyphomicrobiales bacterium]